MPSLAALVLSVVSDVRFAMRYFARHRATTAILVAVLALATGANTLLFSLFQAQFLRPAPQVPSDAAHALVWMQERSATTARWRLVNFNGTQLGLLAERRETFAAVAAWVDDDAIISGGDSAGAQNAPVTFVTPNFLGTLGLSPTHGRDLLPATDAGADLSAVMAEVAAERLFGSADAAVGKRVLVNKVPIDIVGIAPRHFRGATRDDVEPLLFIPLSARSDLVGLPPLWMADSPTLHVFARLSPSASFAQATTVAQQLALATLPDSAQRVGMTRMAEVRHLGAIPPWEEGEELLLIASLLALLGLLVLLVGWMNLSSLMVAAAVARRQEIALRLALGATRGRIIRQLATESTLVSLVGAAVGALAAFWLLAVVSAQVVTGVDLAPDVQTFGFVIALAVVTGVIFGLSPALHATRGVAAALRDSGQGATRKSRLQTSLVVAQIALSQPLLVGLLAMLQALRAAYQPIDAATSRSVIEASFLPSRDSTLPELGPAQVQRLIPRIAERPEVVTVVPAPSAFEVRGLRVADVGPQSATSAASAARPAVVHVAGAAPGWLGVLDVPIVLGRDLQYADTASSDRPAVIGVDLAQALYGEASPIGQRILSPTLRGDGDHAIAFTVVGVYDSRVIVPDMPTAENAAQAGTPYRVYTASGQGWRKDRVLVRTRGPAAAFVTELQRLAISETPLLPIASIRTLLQRDEADRQSALTRSLAAALCALLALCLASLGLYGVVALSVRQRTREIGIRIAIGAEPLRVARMFLRAGMRSATLGLAIGLPVTLVLLQVLIAQGEMRMPASLPLVVGVVVAALLLSVAALATWIPARRAARVDPGLSLRAE